MKWQGNKNFTPTRDFNADDVVFSFERQRDPNHPFHKVSGGTYEYFESMDMGNLLKSVEKVDDHTVKFTLAAPARPSSPTWRWISPRSCRPSMPTR